MPQALAGTLSVLLLYSLVRRHFGRVAGLLAALVLALCPISIVTNRDVTIDSTLTLTLLIGAWAVMRAAESGSLRWLAFSAILVGIGFNIKMLEAYLVVPAYGMLYLLAAPHRIWKRIGHLALAGLLLLVVSFSWLVAVDLTPASQRPYVDSTKDNSALSLALGYNGFERLFGHTPTISTPTAGDGTQQPQTPASQPPSVPGGENGRTPREIEIGGMGFDIGTPGPLRLFGLSLGSQIGWLLPLAVLGMLARAWQQRPNVREDRKLQSLVLWGMWLLTMGMFFSVAGFFHQYYLTVMAPAIAALVGIGLVTTWQDYRRGGGGAGSCRSQSSSPRQSRFFS
ncbi:glycosyltransferase family 39 protein [Ktedonobacter robiniae]|uniref:glycosyltransferase family 39 protein n=1 Tax=Ktedonobacter robiniae TaxID=2778365 RepID=UPI0027DAB867|nr:glycosyltransferase family 39 protein [Ktedonobacter robiniae]